MFFIIRIPTDNIVENKDSFTKIHTPCHLYTLKGRLPGWSPEILIQEFRQRTCFVFLMVLVQGTWKTKFEKHLFSQMRMGTSQSWDKMVFTCHKKQTEMKPNAILCHLEISISPWEPEQISSHRLMFRSGITLWSPSIFPSPEPFWHDSEADRTSCFPFDWCQIFSTNLSAKTSRQFEKFYSYHTMMVSDGFECIRLKNSKWKQEIFIFYIVFCPPL